MSACWKAWGWLFRKSKLIPGTASRRSCARSHRASRWLPHSADVVLLNGARQTGKSTLAQSCSAGEGRRYYTLDDHATLAAAKGDPAGFIAGLNGPVTLDEVRRAPELFLAIKASVDRDRSPGRFLLTGSANVLLLKLFHCLCG
ncbi:MAG: hypothetical protein EPO42_00535 [Gallionellaceae bacterium]|nr:MAG: hypothetical protein EPO42_00535 [Gallionellaceae bacterium]